MLRETQTFKSAAQPCSGEGHTWERAQEGRCPASPDVATESDLVGKLPRVWRAPPPTPACAGGRDLGRTGTCDCSTQRKDFSHCPKPSSECEVDSVRCRPGVQRSRALNNRPEAVPWVACAAEERGLPGVRAGELQARAVRPSGPITVTGPPPGSRRFGLRGPDRDPVQRVASGGFHNMPE